MRELINDRLRKKVEEEDHWKDRHKLHIDGQVFELYMNRFENLNTDK